MSSRLAEHSSSASARSTETPALAQPAPTSIGTTRDGSTKPATTSACFVEPVRLAESVYDGVVVEDRRHDAVALHGVERLADLVEPTGSNPGEHDVPVLRRRTAPTNAANELSAACHRKTAGRERERERERERKAA